MESKLQIFISSTFTDLVEERQAAVEAILKAGHIPAGMELFTAGDKSQWTVIQRWISESDIYMLILGGRYGSIEPDSGTSYIELEYDFAVSSGKPFFAVVIDQDALDLKVKSEGRSVLETTNPDKLNDFRDKVLSKMSSFFSDCKDVKLAVLETVPQLAAEYGLKGWVKASAIPDTKALADELSTLHAENKKLTAKLQQQSKKLENKSQTSQNTDKEFQELAELMGEKMLDMSTSKNSFNNSKEIPDKVSLLNLFISTRDSLSTGVTNQIGTSDLESYIFFKLCPKLQTYDLVQNEKVAGVRYRRYAITKKGTEFLAYLDKLTHKLRKQEKQTTGPKKKSAKKKKTTKKRTSN